MVGRQRLQKREDPHPTLDRLARIVGEWQGFPWEVLAHLHEQGLISDPKTKAKSVVLTEEGEAQARAARN